jgi:hypothetical protein
MDQRRLGHRARAERVGVYFRAPITETDVQQEIERLRHEH